MATNNIAALFSNCILEDQQQLHPAPCHRQPHVLKSKKYYLKCWCKFLVVYLPYQVNRSLNIFIDRCALLVYNKSWFHLLLTLSDVSCQTLASRGITTLARNYLLIPFIVNVALLYSSLWMKRFDHWNQDTSQEGKAAFLMLFPTLDIKVWMWEAFNVSENVILLSNSLESCQVYLRVCRPLHNNPAIAIDSYIPPV